MRGCICFLGGHLFVFFIVSFEFCAAVRASVRVLSIVSVVHVQMNKEFVTRKKQYLCGDVICGVSCQGDGERIFFYLFFLFLTSQR